MYLQIQAYPTNTGCKQAAIVVAADQLQGRNIVASDLGFALASFRSLVDILEFENTN